MRCYFRQLFIWSLVLVFLICLYILNHVNYTLTQNTEDIKKHYITSDDNKPVYAIGILTTESNADERNAVRKTWLFDIHNLPFKIVYKFVMDSPTEQIEKERIIFGDILYTNITQTASGYLVNFGAKFYTWITFVIRNYPEAIVFTKMNDDVSFCVPQMLKRIYDIRSKNTYYYEWKHGTSDQKTNSLKRVDKMFVTLGEDIVQQFAKTRYCSWNKEVGDGRCKDVNDVSRDMFSSDCAEAAIAKELSVHSKALNRNKLDREKMKHYRCILDQNIGLMKYAVHEVCVKNLDYHKIPVPVIHKLHRSSRKNVTMGSTQTSRDIITTTEKYNIGKPVLNNDKMCEYWAVMYTEKVSFNVNFFKKSRNWCLVIVWDNKKKKFPHKIRVRNHVIILTPEEQEIRFPALSNILFWNHKGRRNLGYMYALYHGARYVWDVDVNGLLDWTAVQVYVNDINNRRYDIVPFPHNSTLFSRKAVQYAMYPISVNEEYAEHIRKSINDILAYQNNLKIAQVPQHVVNITKVDTTEIKGHKERLDALFQSIRESKPDFQELYKELYGAGFVEYNDLRLVKMWLKISKGAL